eukprot:4760355-Pyramimonas_sp.AAC.1
MRPPPRRFDPACGSFIRCVCPHPCVPTRLKPALMEANAHRAAAPRAFGSPKRGGGSSTRQADAC